MKQYMKQLKGKILLLVCLVSFFVGAFSYHQFLQIRNSLDELQSTEEQILKDSDYASNQAIPLEQRYPFIVPPKSTLSSLLSQLDISSQEIFELVQAAKPHADLAKLKPGTRFQVTFSEGENPVFTGIRFRFSAQEILDLKKNFESDGQTFSWSVEKIVKPIRVEVVHFQGIVENSLWESAEKASMNPVLIAELAEVFAWQVDFSREVQRQDRWRLTVEKEFIGSEHVGWGSILAAEYINVDQKFTAILFRNGEDNLGYFAPDGSSLKRMFLKSPIQYGRISSRFQKNRFHPVLKKSRPHLGVDYAAPTGTPIRTVGDGVVSFAGWSGGGGKVIKIRHNSIHETAYKHLSRFAKHIKKGTQVQQGETIGYVGSTGLSTGPHLHFEFFVNGRYVDPLGQKFPSADPVPTDLLGSFQENKLNLLSELPEWDSKN